MHRTYRMLRWTGVEECADCSRWLYLLLLGCLSNGFVLSKRSGRGAVCTAPKPCVPVIIVAGLLSHCNAMRAVRLWRQQQRLLLQCGTVDVGASPATALHAPPEARHVCSQLLSHACSHKQPFNTHCQVPHTIDFDNATHARQHATSAEFSGGTFTANTEESSTRDLHNQEPDDKYMLLEAALGYVVSKCLPVHQ